MKTLKVMSREWQKKCNICWQCFYWGLQQGSSDEIQKKFRAQDVIIGQEYKREVTIGLIVEQEHYVALKSNSIKIEVENYYAVHYISTDFTLVEYSIRERSLNFGIWNFCISTPTMENNFSSGMSDQTSTRFIKTTVFGDQSIS